MHIRGMLRVIIQTGTIHCTTENHFLFFYRNINVTIVFYRYILFTVPRDHKNNMSSPINSKYS